MMQVFGWFLTRETVYLEKLKKAKKKDTIYMVYTAKKKEIKICQKLHSYKFGRTLCKYKVIMFGGNLCVE